MAQELLGRCAGRSVRERRLSLLLLEAEDDEAVAGGHEHVGVGERPRAVCHAGDLPHLPPQLQDDPLGGAFPDPLRELDLRHVAACDCETEVVGVVHAADRESHAGADAADGDEGLEQLPFGRGREAVEVEGVLAHHEVGGERHLLADGREGAQGRGGAAREQADAADLDHHRIRLDRSQTSPHRTDHRGEVTAPCGWRP